MTDLPYAFSFTAILTSFEDVQAIYGTLPIFLSISELLYLLMHTSGQSIGLVVMSKLTSLCLLKDVLPTLEPLKVHFFMSQSVCERSQERE